MKGEASASDKHSRLLHQSVDCT